QMRAQPSIQAPRTSPRIVHGAMRTLGPYTGEPCKTGYQLRSGNCRITDGRMVAVPREIVATFHFVRKEEHLRKGLRRLCVAAGITWIGWLGYKSLDAVVDGYGWDGLSGIVWLILLPIGGPITLLLQVSKNRRPEAMSRSVRFAPVGCREAAAPP